MKDCILKRNKMPGKDYLPKMEVLGNKPDFSMESLWTDIQAFHMKFCLRKKVL